MKILALDTATEACSAALYIDGEITERYRLAPREHSRLILPMIDSLMTDAALSPQALDALAFGCGPGSFTGVRIATGIVQGIALAADLPVAPVSTLAALAQQCFDQTRAQTALTAMDARMSEVYWGVYQKNSAGYAELSGLESVGPADRVDFPERPGFGVGSGWGVYKDPLSQRLKGWVEEIMADYLPKASSIVKLSVRIVQNQRTVTAEQATPVYLRNNVAKKAGGQIT